MKAKVLREGVCRYCGCGGDSCKLMDGEKCGWGDKTRTWCTGPDCMAEFHNNQRRAARAPKRTPAQVNALIRKGGKRGGR